MLWGRSGNRCAMPGCRIELVMDIVETDDESLIGEECHIVAQKANGPRGDEKFDINKLDKYENLVLLCRNHHKIIDDNPECYTIEKLKNIKKEHEQWIKSKLEIFDDAKQKDDEQYASYIEKWIDFSCLDGWESWTSYVFCSDDPSLSVERYEQLQELNKWIFTRIWSGRYKKLEDAFENFRRILQDFLNTFNEYSTQKGDTYYTEKFYGLKWHDDESIYRRLRDQYSFHVLLVEDLMIELTRASNYICDMIRKYIDSSFRLNEGILIIILGPFKICDYHQHKVKYSENDLNEDGFFYIDLEDFKQKRVTRDYYRGSGKSADDKE